MPPTELERAIVETVAWFSAQETPVTVFALWRWLMHSAPDVRLREVDGVLTSSAWLASRLQREGVWIAVAGASLSAWVRMQTRDRMIASTRKRWRARWVARVARAVPSVRAVFLAGSVAGGTANDRSDLDFIIVTSPGMLWWSRVLCVLPFALLGLRPGGYARSRDPYCFSCFVSANALDWFSWQNAHPDVSLAFWLRSALPVLDKDGLFPLWQKKNVWPLFSPRFDRSCRFTQTSHSIRAFPMLETLARFFSTRRFPMAVKQRMNHGTNVIVSDRVLKLHTTDRRDEQNAKWRTLVETLCA